jgi:DedD protein
MQKTPSGDQELNLKKRARRRLVGAIALVLLMVIVLPMILKDRAVTQAPEQVTITLPSEHSQTEPSDFDSNIMPAEPAKVETPLVTVPTETANVASEAEPQTDAEARPEAAKPDEAKLAVKPLADTPVKEAANHRFYVQIGVFSDAANVKQLQGKLSDLGYKSQTEKIATDKGKKIRLRTQVFGDRNEAAIALENIKDAGLTGMVVSQ